MVVPMEEVVYHCLGRKLNKSRGARALNEPAHGHNHSEKVPGNAQVNERFNAVLLEMYLTTDTGISHNDRFTNYQDNR